MTRESNLVEAHLVLADLFLLKDDLPQAEFEYKTARSLAPPGSQPWIRLAEYFITVNKPEEAKRVLKEAAEKAPDSPAPLRRLAELALTEQNFDECAGQLAALFKLNPTDPHGLFLQGRLHLAKNEPAEALKAFQEALRGLPNSPQTLYYMAVAYRQAGDSAQARTILRDAVRIDPNMAEAVVLLAELDIAAGDNEPAIEPLLRITARYPDSAFAQKLLGLAYLGKGDPARAESAIRKAIELNPKDARLHFMLGVALDREGKTNEARKSLQKSRTEFPDAMEPLIALVELELRERQFDVALDLVKDQIGRNPQNAQLQFLMGKVHRARQENEAAIAAYQKAISLDARLEVAYLELSSIYLQSKQYKEAIARLESSIKANPNNLPTLMLTGVIYQQEGNTVRAHEFFERVLAVDPGFLPAANNLAYLYSEQAANLDKALKLAQMVREKAPEDPHAADTLGWVLYKQGNFEWALIPLQQSASKLPENAVVHYHLGMTEFKLGNSAPAKAALERALELDPRFAGADEARKALAEITPQ